ISVFFFTHSPNSDTFPLSLHDALPILAALQLATVRNNYDAFVRSQAAMLAADMLDRIRVNRERVVDYEVDFYDGSAGGEESGERSEEHTSELQLRENLVCRLLLEKQKG